MNYDNKSHQFPAPCIIDSGTIVNKDDMRRLLDDLSRVRYVHLLDDKIQSEGEGWVIEIFTHPHQATMVANHNIYLNLQSFDYLQLHQLSAEETYFDLIQDNRKLRLIPLAQCFQDPDVTHNLDAATLEAMLTQVLSARWDVQLDDESGF